MQAAFVANPDRGGTSLDINDSPQSYVAMTADKQAYKKLCCKTPAPGTQITRVSQIQLGVQTNTPPQSCGRSFCNKALSVISWPFEKMHTPAVATLLATASLVGAVTTAFFPQYQVTVISCIALGYFGQTVASMIAKKPAAKPAALVCSRVQQHTSLATMMLAGFYKKELWAIKLNCALFGMLLRLKLQTEEEVPTTIPQESPKIIPLIAGTSIALTLMTTGLVGMYALGQAGSPRTLSLATACAIYGIKGLGAILGYATERYLEANKANCALKVINSGISKIEGIGMGLCYLGNKATPINASASFLALPIGFLLGTSISRMMRMSELQDSFFAMVDHEQNEALSKSRCDKSSFILHTLAFIAFEVAGACFLKFGTDDTIGYEVFFMLTPFLYAIIRFLFSKEQSNNSRVQKAGHFLLHKSPQLISEELNYSLSFAQIKAITQNESNLRIFYVFQSLLMASIEASLFELDEHEDRVRRETQITIDTEQKLAILGKIRREATRNYARMDMIIPVLANTFNIKL